MGPEILVFIVCMCASVVGAICGIGGGVIIKPVLDSMQLMTASQVSFLSGCTVLSMSLYSVTAATVRGERNLDILTTLPMGFGAAAGGILGKLLFQQLSQGAEVGTVQSVCLLLLTVGTFFYTLLEERIFTKQIRGIPVCLLTGLILGVFSSFLGIGGGPINLVILSYLFSMQTKKAASNSLCIILISQTASLLYSALSGSIPDFSWAMLALMVCAGITGGIIGRKINKKISAKYVHKLFLTINVVIVLICAYNIFVAL